MEQPEALAAEVCAHFRPLRRHRPDETRLR
jgi:hypothetical protein